MGKRLCRSVLATGWHAACTGCLRASPVRAQHACPPPPHRFQTPPLTASLRTCPAPSLGTAARRQHLPPALAIIYPPPCSPAACHLTHIRGGTEGASGHDGEQCSWPPAGACRDGEVVGAGDKNAWLGKGSGPPEALTSIVRVRDEQHPALHLDGVLQRLAGIGWQGAGQHGGPREVQRALATRTQHMQHPAV